MFYSFTLSSRHPARLKKKEAFSFSDSWDYLCGRSDTAPAPWTSGKLAQATAPLTQPTATERAVEKPVAGSSRDLIQSNLTDFWQGFNPDLHDLEDPPSWMTCGRSSACVQLHGVKTSGMSQQVCLQMTTDYFLPPGTIIPPAQNYQRQQQQQGRNRRQPQQQQQQPAPPPAPAPARGRCNNRNQGRGWGNNPA